MFNLDPNPTFTAAVPLSVPGLSQPLDVDFTFRHLTTTGVEKWFSRWIGKRSHEVLAEVIVGWAMKRNGEPVPYSVSALAELCEAYTPARGEISDAFLLELTQAKKKISSGQPNG